VAIPLSLFVIAGGAILAFAVTGNTSGIDIHAVGWILMVAGLVGLVLSFIMWDSWAGGGYWSRRGHAEPPPPPRRPYY
jgi:hypothetical protein